MFVNYQDNVIETINNFEYPSDEVLNNLSSKNDDIRITAAKEIVKWQCRCFQLGIMLDNPSNENYLELKNMLSYDAYYIAQLNRIIRDISENKPVNINKEYIDNFMSFIEKHLYFMKEEIKTYNSIPDKESIKVFLDKCFEVRKCALLSLKQLIN